MNAVASVEPSYLIVSSPLSGFVIVNESVALSKSRVSDASVTVAACLSLAAKECDRITVPSQSTNSTVWVAPVTKFYKRITQGPEHSLTDFFEVVFGLAVGAVDLNDPRMHILSEEEV